MPSTRYLTGKNVFEAAEARFDWIYGEFENVMVSTSGGKDSTVMINLAIRAAERAGRLPIKAFFFDEEFHWQATIDFMRKTRDDPRIDLTWVQVPIWYDNNSDEEYWVRLWDPDKEDLWVHPREPTAMTENTTNEEYFYQYLEAFNYQAVGENGVALLGLRAEESPLRTARIVGKSNTYKFITWNVGGTYDKNLGRKSCRRLAPIYDWSWTDIWKAIHVNGWEYCEMYDKMWRHSQLGINQMRLSSLMHSRSFFSIFHIHELEPETWSRLARRIHGFNTSRQMGIEAVSPTEVPEAFENWIEYRDYLLDKLINREEHRKNFLNTFRQGDYHLGKTPWADEWYQACVWAIIYNDHNPTEGTLMAHMNGMRKWAT